MMGRTDWRVWGVLIGGGLWLAGMPWAARGAERTSWHHNESPYRAILNVTQEPTARDAGYAVAVPVSEPRRPWISMPLTRTAIHCA